MNFFFKLSYLSLNFPLTLGYLNPSSNNPAQEDMLKCALHIKIESKIAMLPI